MLLDVFASFIIKNLITQPIPTNRRRAFLPKKSYLTSGTWPVAKGGALGGNGDPSLNAAENDFPIEI